MKIISQILVIAIINLNCTYSYAWVDPVTTNIGIHKKSVVKVFRQQLLDLANRQEVINRMALYGVSQEQAINRINSLTDEEIEQYIAKIDQLPSGGEQPSNLQYIFMFIVVLPVYALMLPVFIIIRISSSVLCLNHLDDYQNCFNNNAGMVGSPYPAAEENLKPVSCLEPCYHGFNDCMDSSGTYTEENQCREEKRKCIKQC